MPVVLCLPKNLGADDFMSIIIADVRWVVWKVNDVETKIVAFVVAGSDETAVVYHND